MGWPKLSRITAALSAVGALPNGLEGAGSARLGTPSKSRQAPPKRSRL